MESTTCYTFPVQSGGIFYFPWHGHQIVGTNSFLLSPPKDTDTQSVMLRARFVHLKYNMPGPEIEPRSSACHAGVLTTTLPRLSYMGLLTLQVDGAYKCP